jgi:CRP/FNR family transcriptional regulator, cyclic AMP receptor protein
VRVNHNLAQKELGELTGSSREMVSKWLREFSDRGWIKVESKSMLIYDQQRLAGRAR